MSTIDLVCAGVILFCTVLGFSWGVIRQVLSVVGLVAGIVLATAYHREAADMLSSLISSDLVAQAAGFALIAFSVSAAASLAASLLQRLAGLLFLGWLDHLIGGAIGLVQGIVVCVVGLLIMRAVPGDLGGAMLDESQLAGPLLDTVGVVLVGLLPESLRTLSSYAIVLSLM